MSDELPPPPGVTDSQRNLLLAILRREPYLGTIAAARRAGVPGTKAEIRARLVAADLDEEIQVARGRELERVETTLYEIATNPEHPQCVKAAEAVLRARHPLYRDERMGQLTEGAPRPPTRMEVGLEDVIRLAERVGILADLGLGRRDDRPDVEVADARRLLPSSG